MFQCIRKPNEQLTLKHEGGDKFPHCCCITELGYSAVVHLKWAGVGVAKRFE